MGRDLPRTVVASQYPPATFTGRFMGIYDRAYLQEEERGGGWAPGRSMVINLIIVNAVVYLAGIFVDPEQLNSWLSLKSDLFTHPWQVWQLISYGFAHDGFMHILFNMAGLFIFGRELEGMYGRFEFLRIYLLAIVLAGLVWVFMQVAAGGNGSLVGASGGVMSVVMLWILHFPMRLVYIWGVIPVRAWILGTVYIAGDVLGMFNKHEPGDGPQVANVAHLAGVGFAFIYFRTKMNLGRLIPSRLSDLKPKLFRPKLRIHDPDKEASDLNQQVDAILEKISREGEASLTKKERKTLEEASRRYQRRRP
jgi:membrane associated rhomboid family serine protease